MLKRFKILGLPFNNVWLWWARGERLAEAWGRDDSGRLWVAMAVRRSELRSGRREKAVRHKILGFWVWGCGLPWRCRWWLVSWSRRGRREESVRHDWFSVSGFRRREGKGRHQASSEQKRGAHQFNWAQFKKILSSNMCQTVFELTSPSSKRAPTPPSHCLCFIPSQQN